jgi:hypothetical protein
MSEDEVDLSATTTATATAIVTVTAVLLFFIGGLVMIARHSPDSFPFLRSDLLAMAFNTATCMLLSAICLVSLLARWRWLLRFFALAILALSALTLLDLFRDGQMQIDTLLSIGDRFSINLHLALCN